MKPNPDKFRYRFLYKLVHLATPFLLRKYRFRTDRLKKADGNYIVMSNHLTEVDMFMLCEAFPRHMYYVAGEHLTRSRQGRLLIWAQHPIFEYKGAVAVETVREIVRRVRRGNNVMIFPEGSRSFTGVTEPLPESAAKLVKLARCGLVTYHIEGGYFVAPRWAYTARKGPMTGRIVHVFSAAEVAAMSKEELTAAINADLYENAYETQRKKHARYTGERLAEGLENYLVCCSRCGAFDSMVTKDNTFTCTCCGQSGVYTEEGFLTGEDLRFDNVRDWGRWSEEETERCIREADGDGPLFRDGGVKLFEITEDHRQADLAEGELLGYADRLELSGHVFPLAELPAMNMLYFGKTLLFTHEDRHYGITGERFHAIKYQKLYDLCKAGSAAAPAAL